MQSPLQAASAAVAPNGGGSFELFDTPGLVHTHCIRSLSCFFLLLSYVHLVGFRQGGLVHSLFDLSYVLYPESRTVVPIRQVRLIGIGTERLDTQETFPLFK